MIYGYSNRYFFQHPVLVNSVITLLKGKQCTTRESYPDPRYDNAYGLRITPILEEFIQAQSSDGECQMAAQIVGFPDLSFMYDLIIVLVRLAPVDAAMQRYVPVALWARVHLLSEYLTLVGALRERNMHDPMRNNFS